MLKEFKTFIMRGNVMDLAVAVIIGGAFGKIVTSLVDDIIMPLIGLIIGGINFMGLAFTLGNAKVTYGNFIQNVVDFLIIASVIFLMVKAISQFAKTGSRRCRKFQGMSALLHHDSDQSHTLPQLHIGIVMIVIHK